MTAFNNIYNLLTRIMHKSTGPKVLIAFLLTLFLFSIFGFYFIPVIVQSTGGLMPLDTLFPLTAEVIYADLPSYNNKAIAIYWGFIALDCIYPFALAGFFVLFWAFLINKIQSDKLFSFAASGFILFPFLGAMLDMMENIGIATIIYSYPSELWSVAHMVEYFRIAKLSSQGVMMLITVTLVISACIASFRRPVELTAH